MDIIAELNSDLENIIIKFEDAASCAELVKGMLDLELVEFVIKALKYLIEYYDTDIYTDIAEFLRSFGYHFFYNGDVDNYLKYSKVDFYKLDVISLSVKCDQLVLEELLKHYSELVKCFV